MKKPVRASELRLKLESEIEIELEQKMVREAHSACSLQHLSAQRETQIVP